MKLIKNRENRRRAPKRPPPVFEHILLKTNLLLWQRRICVLRQLKRHLGEPLSGAGVDQPPYRVFRTGSVARAATVRFAWNLDPQIGIDQRVAGVCGGAQTQSAVGRVAPVLRVRVDGRRCPGSLPVAAGVDDEMLEQRIGVPPGLAFDVVRVPLICQPPGAEVARTSRVILAGTPIEMTKPPGGRIRGKGYAFGDPRT